VQYQKGVSDPTLMQIDRDACCANLLRDVLDEPGRRLDVSIRRRMEQAFSADFSSVVIHTSRNSDKLTRQVGANALTVRNHICFSACSYNPHSTVGQLTLAHELAHIVQKRRGKYDTKHGHSLNASLFEAEAAWASLHVVGCNACPALSSDPTDIPRLWGPEGHYFTVLLIARLAGLASHDALRLAFYAQLPDQIDDLDAIVAGKAWAETIAVRTILPVTGPLITRPAQPHLNVQAALHCLNGNLASAETSFRAEVLNKQSFDAAFHFEYGLALHAFGDSFAHRNSDLDAANMFTYPYGHLLKYQQNFHPEDLMGLGEAIDNINRRAKLYRQYGVDMYRILLRRSGKEGKPPVPFADLEKMLADISSSTTGSAQIESIREKMRDPVPGTFAAGKLDSYLPEDNPMPWDQFSRLHPTYVTPDMKDRAQRWIFRMAARAI
jgi:Domain of unknown function (DUF4157)